MKSLILILLLVTIRTAYGQGSCVVMWQETPWIRGQFSKEEEARRNRDSCYFDTCQSSPTYQHMWCRRGYGVSFEYYVFPAPHFPRDTSFYYDWNAIDTSFTSIRAGFASLEAQLGHFIFPTGFYANDTDTTSSLSRRYEIRFDSLVNVDTALALLEQIPSMSAGFVGAPLAESDVSKADSRLTKLWPTACRESLYVSGPVRDIHIYDGLGRELVLPLVESADRIVFDCSTLTAQILYVVSGKEVLKVIHLKQ